MNSKSALKICIEEMLRDFFDYPDHHNRYDHVGAELPGDGAAKQEAIAVRNEAGEQIYKTLIG